MSMTMAGDSLAILATSLKAEMGGAQTVLTQFPSGSAMLDVRSSDGRVFVLAYTPAQGYGVDELQTGDGIGTGYRFGYADLMSAAQKLRELIADRPAAGVSLD